MGKGGPNEDLPNFAGCYQGAGSIEPVRDAIEDKSDCVLWLGSFRVGLCIVCCTETRKTENEQTDFNTGEFTDNVKESVMIDFQRFFTKVCSSVLSCRKP